MDQIARSATQETWGYLDGCRYVLHDRDTKFCASFRSVLAGGGVKTITLPARSPNLNAFAERWVGSAKQGSKLILFGEGPLSRTLAEFSAHYHGERNHQGKGSRLLFPDAADKTERRSHTVESRPRLGGLKFGQGQTTEVIDLESIHVATRGASSAAGGNENEERDIDSGSGRNGARADGSFDRYPSGSRSGWASFLRPWLV